MDQVQATPAPSARDERIQRHFEPIYDALLRRTDRMFGWLMLVQWIVGIGIALWVSPRAWAGMHSVVHSHVLAAIFVGAAITSLPVALAFMRPGKQSTRYVVACGQVLSSALLIHLTGGRIETHFHIFGSLAILAFYRDFKVLVPATIVVATDHFVRSAFWPESVFGLANPEWWRFLEHAGWVVFIDAFLIVNCLQSYKDLWDLSSKQIDLEDSRESLVRVERLAAVGQLAASVGHELRNPLAAVRNAQTYISKRLAGQGNADPKIEQFLGIMRRELDASTRIISNLLDFSRAREPSRTLCPLQPLVAEAIGLVPGREGVVIKNEIPNDLPIPELDKDQFRQVFINLIQNAVEAMPAERAGEVVVGAAGGGAAPWRVTVTDNGAGMSSAVLEKIFQPLFSTKTKGTGLGLAVVQGIVERHGGKLRVESEVGKGTTFIAELPAHADRRAA